jgi:hypothetical protein
MNYPPSALRARSGFLLLTSAAPSTNGSFAASDVLLTSLGGSVPSTDFGQTFPTSELQITRFAQWHHSDLTFE